MHNAQCFITVYVIGTDMTFGLRSAVKCLLSLFLAFGVCGTHVSLMAKWLSAIVY